MRTMSESLEIRPGTILWRRHDNEPAPKLVEVTQRLQDVDSGHMEYVLQDMTHTTRDQYHEDDLADCFWPTGLHNEEVKPIMDERIREVYQRVCDHSFTTVHDPETSEPAGEQCLHCRILLPIPDGGECPDCESGEYVELVPDNESGTGELICMRHGVLKKIQAGAP